MSTFCPRCGTSRLPQAKFCAGCGFDFEATDRFALPLAPAAAPLEAATLATEVPIIEVAEDFAVVASPMIPLFSEPLPALSPEPTTPRSKRPRRSLVVAAGAAVLVLALLASAVYGFTTNQSLERTNAKLGTTAANLASTTDTLTSTQGELGSTKTDLTTEADAHSQADATVERLNNQVSGLQSQLEARDACVASLRADEVQLQKISREQNTQFNRGAKDSALVKADVAYTSALIEVAHDYYNAFSNAYDGYYATANSWVAEGNSASSRAAQAAKLYNAEISKINAGTKKVDAEGAALSDSITKTLSLCNAAAGSS
jgi:hypothetical protein